MEEEDKILGHEDVHEQIHNLHFKNGPPIQDRKVASSENTGEEWYSRVDRMTLEGREG